MRAGPPEHAISEGCCEGIKGNRRNAPANHKNNLYTNAGKNRVEDTKVKYKIFVKKSGITQTCLFTFRP